MTKKYTILWIDDEHEKLGGFKLQAAQNDIILKPHKSRVAGVAELKANFVMYDGILLDAKFFNEEDDAQGSEDLSALNIVKEALLQLPKKFKLFVLTGQAELFEDKTFNSFFPSYYRKGIADDITKLFTDLKVAADDQVDTQIRHKFQSVFEVCTEKYIGTEATTDLLNILKNEEFSKVFLDPGLYLNPLRKVIEDLFTSFNKYGFLPDAFVKPIVAINESSKFLSGGIEKGYRLTAPVFPKVVSDLVRNVLAVCQPASHRTEIDQFIKDNNTPYLLLSVTYQMLDILIWFKRFVDVNGDIEANKLRYRLLESILEVASGSIEQDEFGNFHCGEIVLTYTHVRQMGYKKGDVIRFLKVTKNTNEKTMRFYPKSSFQTEKL